MKILNGGRESPIAPTSHRKRVPESAEWEDCGGRSCFGQSSFRMRHGAAVSPQFVVPHTFQPIAPRPPPPLGCGRGATICASLEFRARGRLRSSVPIRHFQQGQAPIRPLVAQLRHPVGRAGQAPGRCCSRDTQCRERPAHRPARCLRRRHGLPEPLGSHGAERSLQHSRSCVRSRPGSVRSRRALMVMGWKAYTMSRELSRTMNGGKSRGRRTATLVSAAGDGEPPVHGQKSEPPIDSAPAGV